MAANAKIEMQAEKMMTNLNLRLATASYRAPVTKSYSSGDVLLQLCRSAGALDDRAMILLAPAALAASGLTDALGLTQRVYSPHVIKVLFDKDASDGTKGTAETSKLAILAECLLTGMRVELYEIDAEAKGGNKYLEVADIAAGNFIAAFESLEWGALASV